MNTCFALAIHHKGRWLFDRGGMVIRPWDGACEQAVSRFLMEHLHAKKFDIAPVETVTEGDTAYSLFVIDISAFEGDLPTELSSFSKQALPPLSPIDQRLFTMADEHITACRRVTRALLGQEVDIIMDRPVGTHHPKHPDIIYPINYGYLDGLLSADGEGIDVYLLGVHEPLERFHAKVIAVICREDDIEDKLAAAPVGMDFSEEEIAEAVRFQEQFYRSTVSKNA